MEPHTAPGGKWVFSLGVKSAIYPSRLPGAQPRRREHKAHPAGFALDTLSAIKQFIDF